MVAKENTSAYAAHEEVDLMLPWYVNGSLNDADKELVSRHLDVCLSCRRELAEQQKLHIAILSTEATVRLPQRSFAKLAGRINGSAPAPAIRKAGIRRGFIHWLGGINQRLESQLFRAALPALALATLVVALPNSGGIEGWTLEQRDHRYRTLSESDGGAARAAESVKDISIAFNRGMTESVIQGLADRHHATIVSGPDALGLYTMRLSEIVNPTVLAQIKREAGVLLAEPTMTASTHAGNGRGGQHTR